MRSALTALLLILVTGCAGTDSLGTAERRIVTAEGLMAPIRELSSDAYEGRAPGTRGEERTVQFIESEMRRIGLAPGNPNGTFVQEVPLVGVRSVAQTRIEVEGQLLPLRITEDLTAGSFRLVDSLDIDRSEIVFVGYGVTAPEYDWDDFKGVDLRGKTLLILVNDPPVRDPNQPDALDSTVFKGRAMTYYGRWTYKYEEAARRGAAGAIIVHETGPAGYPYAVIQSSWNGETFCFEQVKGNLDHPGVESWMTDTAAMELLRRAGLDFKELKARAVRRDFRPVALNATASFRVRNTIREVKSRNVVGLLRGSDPVLANEYVLYSAHWDHLGRDTTLQGDTIFNGAVDNATGTAAMLKIAETFATLPVRPKRSIVFLAVTAEEQGLLGSGYYAGYPLYPAEKTLAAINIDGLGVWGRTRDIVVTGYGTSTLEDLLALEAKGQGRVVVPDGEPETGGYYRSDHFSFAKVGIPALSAGSGTVFVDKPAGYGQQVSTRYIENDYHMPTDEVRSDWDLSGAVEDAILYFRLGYRIAQTPEWPSWKEGAEFKAMREAMLHRPGAGEHAR